MRRLVMLVALAACTSNRRLDTLERRMQEREAADEDRHKQLDRMEAEIATLEKAIEAQTTATDLAELSRQIDDLGKVVAALARPQPPAAKRRLEPDPADVYAVPVAGASSEGPADALVTIVDACDYASPFCQKFIGTLADLRKKYPKELRIVYRAFIVHPQIATLPAEAACAARRQGLFAQMDERLWSEAFMAHKFDQAEIDTIAGEVGADVDKLHRDIAGDCATEVTNDTTMMTKFGAGATPTFFINGHYVVGLQPLATFETLIDDELALAKSRIKKGGKKARKSYYDTWIVKQGKPEFTPP